MGQLGTMIFFMLPAAVKAGRASLLAIPLAGMISCILSAWAEGRQSRVYTRIRKILAAGFGLWVWYCLSRVLAGYLGWEQYWPAAGAVLLALLLLGRRGQKETSGLKSLWSKVVGILLTLLLVFQIPSLNPKYVFQVSGSSLSGFWKEALFLLAINIPFWLELGKSTAGMRRPVWKKQLGLWSLFFLIFVVLAAVYRFPVLIQSEQVFLNLGRSAAWFGKTPVRMEVPADIVLWVSLFFTLWECEAALREPETGTEQEVRRENQEKKKEVTKRCENDGSC